MKKEGCNEEFIDAFEDAARIGRTDSVPVGVANPELMAEQ